MDGVLNINKPQNMTSFDVVAIVRSLTGVKKVGHFGTLDPMATGVLPVAVGKATRISEYLLDETKEYVAEIKLGITTDTDDIWGTPVEIRGNGVRPESITEEDFRNAIRDFIGEIDQLPPKYSAIKVSGKKLYEYARSGAEVEIKNRRVRIDSIELMKYDISSNSALIRVKCSKGTYIRSLARDIGNLLGCGGCMSGLIRAKSGMFSIAEATPVEELREMSREDIESLLIPLDKVLSEYDRVILADWEEKLFSNGVKLRRDQWTLDGEGEHRDLLLTGDGPKKYVRVYGKNLGFIGMGTVMNSGELKADKVLL